MSGWWGSGGVKGKFPEGNIAEDRHLLYGLPSNSTCSTDVTYFATDIRTPMDHQEYGPAYLVNLWGE